MTRRRGGRPGRGRPSSAAEGEDVRDGRVVATRGRRVLVRDDEGERVCFLAGHRAVIGDRVRWVPAQGEGGKLVAVLDREGALVRTDAQGREQVLAAHLTGLMIVAAARSPPFRIGLVDRYVVACSSGGLAPLVVVNKADEGVPDDVLDELTLRRLDVCVVSAVEGTGLAALRERLGAGTWAMVGHSGVGKTSLVGALLPDTDVGPVGELSDYWGTGQHTTTGSTLFSLPTGGEVVDSPGIRTFAPQRLDTGQVRMHFPGIGALDCRYRDCLHRPGEDGCVAEDVVPDSLLASYRRLLGEVLSRESSRR